jgi:hypothetical protein
VIPFFRDIHRIFASAYHTTEELKNAITVALCDITQNIVGGCTEFCTLSSDGYTEGRTCIEKVFLCENF